VVCSATEVTLKIQGLSRVVYYAGIYRGWKIASRGSTDSVDVIEISKTEPRVAVTA
jgi:hypothetical protein